ncbi:protein FAR1-RELATED SEQUENCE 5-like [Spinacia oleracea]|uniref:Protein FAR1-RELATED SEQUENCE 5-like n=1 Tax=Spinacia oleracea TaxID=3562 RepID=A0ABM3R8A3_SPIOL|nr:protein FAR1-RELATED SEQUENCE 5-like [Spinacia oleracea]
MASFLSKLCSVTDFTSKASIDAILAEINADNSSILSVSMKELSKEVVVVEEASESELMLKEVRSDDEGYEMYKDYAFRKGFNICKGLIRTSRRTDLWSMRRFVCSNAGFKDVKKEILRKYERYLLRSQRDITEEQLKYLSKKVGGSPSLGFITANTYNALAAEKAMKLDGKDCNQLIKYFAQRQASESDFYYDFELDEHECLISLFWRDRRMKQDYEYFGDLLVFDTTYRTNRYDMICAPVVRMNHHCNNVVFGLGFMVNESIASFIWLFESFLRSMGGGIPKTIMTDQAHAIVAAIRDVFPGSRHRLCMWHLGENLKKNIATC